MTLHNHHRHQLWPDSDSERTTDGDHVHLQVVNGAVLPFVLIFMIKLINDKKLMGSYTNKPTFNIIAWITVASMIVLTIVMTVDIAFPGFIKRLLSF